MFASASPEQAVKRFDKKTPTTVSIPRPAIVGIYNECMGGVDLLDMLVALYRHPRKGINPFEEATIGPIKSRE
ncbi:hypothetical protein MRX96_028926 [Rhipicephalus microplus]